MSNVNVGCGLNNNCFLRFVVGIKYFFLKPTKMPRGSNVTRISFLPEISLATSKDLCL